MHICPVFLGHSSLSLVPSKSKQHIHNPSHNSLSFSPLHKLEQLPVLLETVVVSFELREMASTSSLASTPSPIATKSATNFRLSRSSNSNLSFRLLPTPKLRFFTKVPTLTPSLSFNFTSFVVCMYYMSIFNVCSQSMWIPKG